MPVIGQGVEICTSTTRPTNPIVGTIIYETDTASYRWCTSISPSITWTGMIPVGTVQPFAGSAAPVGWLFCFGQTLNASTNPEYADLWAALSTTYGGTSISAFNVPDLRGRAAAGKDNMGGTTASRITSAGSGIVGTTLGASGGTQTHTLTEAQMPSHFHTGTTGYGYNSGGSTNLVVGPNSGSYVYEIYNQVGNTTDSQRHRHDITTNTAGSGGGHQNTQPTIILNYIIKF